MPIGSTPTMAASIHFIKPANPSSLFSNANGSTITIPREFTALAHVIVGQYPLQWKFYRLVDIVYLAF